MHHASATHFVSAAMGVLAVLLAVLLAAHLFADDLPALKRVKRIVVLGDSITYGGLYIDYIEAYLYTRFPGAHVEIINLGLPSETASGLSEPGHAGGAFPRPCIHERLDRALAKTKPDLVIACYGMNDGIYEPLDEGRFKAFRDGMTLLVKKVTASGAKMLVLTPPMFDAVALKADPKGGYDEVLAAYSQWLLDQRKHGWNVADIHGPMTHFLASRRKTEPGFILAGDGIHAGPVGHWLMARPVLEAWKAPAEVDEAEIDLAAGKAVHGKVRDLSVAGEIISFEWQTRRPMPMDPQWDAASVKQDGIAERFNRQRLIVRGAKGLRYAIYEGDHGVGVVTREEMAAGIDMTRFADLSSNQGGAEMLGLIRQRNAMLTDSWLTFVGHNRPGMATGMPLADAQKQAEELEAKIRAMAQPMTLKLRLVDMAQVRGTVVPLPGATSDYHGYQAHSFKVDGCDTIVVAPKEAAAGNPWIWRAEFFDHRPEADLALLAKGFHLVYITVGNTFGCPDAMAHWMVLWHQLTETYGLSRKPALEGLSRGGLYVYNWAEANPDKVSCIYGDNPVLDFKSWPGGKGKGPGSPDDWKALIADYHFADEAAAMAYGKNPIDNLKPLVDAHIALIHVVADADEVVPYEENTVILVDRYRKMGGTIETIVKHGFHHHPHGLDDPTPVVDFVMKHTPKAGE
jgi:lysophospholipase L1-like esterase/pimeloyl-ACP methyl ester carboxylesterase